MKLNRPQTDEGSLVLTEEEITARVDAIFETYKLRDDPHLRSTLLALPRTYYQPRRPFRDRLQSLGNWWDRKWSQFVRSLPELLMILLSGGVVVVLIGGLILDTQHRSKDWKLKTQQGYVYRTRELYRTSDQWPIAVLVQTRVRGDNIPELSAWTTNEIHGVQAKALENYLGGKPLKEVLTFPPEHIERLLLLKFADHPSYFSEGHCWIVSTTVRVEPIATPEEKDEGSNRR